LAGIFKKTTRTIYTWLNLWETRCFAGLYERKGRGRKPKLSPSQREKVKEWTTKFPKNLKKIIALIKENFGVSVSKRTIIRILRSFSFRKKPKGEPEPKVYNQKKEQLSELKKQAETGEINLYFFDETGFCQEPYIPYAWQEKGSTTQISSGRKMRLNILGFLSIEDGLTAYTTESNVDSELVIAVIDAFSSNIEKRSVVVMDNSSFHTSH
jgi:transposase